MTTVIKNGTIVTADLTYKADVLIDRGVIIHIGENLVGDEMLDATGCYVMPGGIDPHTHLEMPFMGTFSADDFESGTRAALSGGTTMVVDFILPGQGQGLMDAAKCLAQQVGPGELRLFLPHGGDLVGAGGVGRDGRCREGRHHLVQALHGLQGRADGERRRDVRLVPPRGRPGRRGARPCRERRCGGRVAGAS